MGSRPTEPSWRRCQWRVFQIIAIAWPVGAATAICSELAGAGWSGPPATGRTNTGAEAGAIGKPIPIGGQVRLSGDLVSAHT